MTYIIAQPCVDLLDKSCIEECPVDCIYEGERMLYIHPDECVDCGACEPVCPVEAIFYEDDVPDQWKDFYKANVDFFEDLGSPGRRVQGRQDRQGPPAVAALPPQARGRADPGRAGCRAFPWDLLAPYRREGPGPSRRDRRPVRRHAGRPGAAGGAPTRWRPPPTRPATQRLTGTAALREAAAGWLARRHGVSVDPDAVLPVIGTKEFIAGLPTLLGCGPGDVVVLPGARLPDLRRRGAAGRGQAGGGRRPVALGPERGPAGLAELAVQPDRPGAARRAPGKMVSWARERGAVVASDECYLEPGLGRRSRCRCLHPDVCGGSHAGLLAVHSLSKRSNMAGLPGRLRHRRPGPDRRAAGDPQARRDDDAGPGAGGDGRRAGRRRARRRAAGPVRGAARPAAAPR